MNNRPFVQYANTIYSNTENYNPVQPQIPKSDFLSTEQLYNAVFENAFHSMYIANGLDDIIKFNDKLTRLFGYSDNEMIDFKSTDLFDIYENSFIDFMNKRKEKGIAKAEITGIKKSGERFPLRISSVVYETESGEKRSMNTLVNLSKSLSARWNIAG
jgi:PAS domain S-box-containing protein